MLVSLILSPLFLVFSVVLNLVFHDYFFIYLLFIVLYFLPLNAHVLTFRLFP